MFFEQKQHLFETEPIKSLQINIHLSMRKCLLFFSMVKTITKNDVVSEVANKSGISKAQVAKTLDALFDVLTSNTKKGNKVALTGYITLKTVERKARKGFNPSTKKPITIPAKKVVKASLGTKFDL